MACPVTCGIPEGLSFCQSFVGYRACVESAEAAERLAQAWANASGVLECEQGVRAACLGHFPACEISTDTRALCLDDCEAQLRGCGAEPARCSAPGSRVASAGDKCFGSAYTGASYGMWALGLGINLLFSFMAALGLNLQKRSLAIHAESDVPLHRQPLWMCGFCTMTCGSVFDFVAFGLAPLALLAPLAALTLVWNMLIARWLHSESVDRSNLIATGMIFVGVTVAVLFSSHSTPLYTAEKLLALFVAPAALAYLALTVVAVAASGYGLWRAGPDRPWWKVFAFGLLAGALGGQSVMFAKATVELLKAAVVGAGTLLSPTPWVMGALTAGLLATQLRVLNAGLDQFDALVMIPVYQSVWILASTVSGLVYFGEWGALTGMQQGLFVLGTAVTLSGIGVLLRGSASRTADTAGMTQLPTDEDCATDSDGGDGDSVPGLELTDLDRAAAAAARDPDDPDASDDSDGLAILTDGDLGAGNGAGGFNLEVPKDGAFAVADDDFV